MTSVFSFFSPVPDLQPDLQRGLTRGDREVRLGGQIAFVGTRFQQPSAFRGCETVGEAKGPIVLIDGFPVCPVAGRPSRCLRSVTQHRGPDPQPPRRGGRAAPGLEVRPEPPPAPATPGH